MAFVITVGVWVGSTGGGLPTARWFFFLTLVYMYTLLMRWVTSEGGGVDSLPPKYFLIFVLKCNMVRGGGRGHGPPIFFYYYFFFIFYISRYNII